MVIIYTVNYTFSRTLGFASGGGITDESVVSDSSSTVAMTTNSLAILTKRIELYTHTHAYIEQHTTCTCIYFTNFSQITNRSEFFISEN